MMIIGLTGSIGMGKTETARIFRRLGVPVFDADAAVHGLLGPGGAAVDAVAAAFPEAVADGTVDRKRLGAAVFGKDEDLQRLERLLHPLVRKEQARFLARCARRRLPRAVLDIPLLFETGGDRLCDAVAVVSAPAHIQRDRVLGRPGMTESTFAAILARQMPDRDKRRRADAVIPSGLGLRAAHRAVVHMLARNRHCRGGVWPQRFMGYGL